MKTINDLESNIVKLKLAELSKLVETLKKAEPFICITSHDWPKSVPYLRLKVSKYSSAAPEKPKSWTELARQVLFKILENYFDHFRFIEKKHWRKAMTIVDSFPKETPTKNWENLTNKFYIHQNELIFTKSTNNQSTW